MGRPDYPLRHAIVLSEVAPKGILPVLFLGVLVTALDIAVVGPALPAIAEHFGVSERGVAWVFNIFVLFNLVGLPVATKMADVGGRRLVYAVEIALFGVGALIVASAPTFGVLLMGRGVQGLGTAGLLPIASAVIGDVYPPERRGRALGLIGAVFGLAFIIGPILGGVLLRYAGWPWLFLLSLPIVLLVFVLSLRRLPGAAPHTTRRLDWPGLGVLGLGLAALAFGMNGIDAEAFGTSLASARVWPFLLAAVVLALLFVVIERRAEEPVVRLRLLRGQQVMLANALSVGAGLTEAAFVFFPALAIAAFGVTKSTASFMLLPLVFALAIGSPLGGRLLDRVGSRAIVLASTALLILGLGLLALRGDVRALFYTGEALIGLGMAGLLGSALSYIVLTEAPETERTVAQGALRLFRGIGRLLGGAVIGALAASGAGVLGYRLAFGSIAVFVLILALLALGLKRRSEELRPKEA